ncbi:MAG: zf-HC2 domain-containing protein [Chloroflexi bacterium]|nr:zf-HC2 domain-containing protein [Chloroflexota bacterium]
MFQVFWRWSRTGHGRYSGLLSEHIDGRLDHAARARLEVHLATCAACREEMESLRATVALLRRAPQAEVPRSFRLQAAPRPSPRSRVQGPLVPALGAASAVAALLLALLVVGDFAGLFPTASAPTPGPAALRAAQGPQGVAGPVPQPAAVPTPTPAPVTSSEWAAKADLAATAPTPTPAPQTATFLKDSGGEAATAVVTTPTVVLTPAPQPTAEAPEPPRSAVASILRALKVALGAAVAVLAGTTAYLGWRGRREREA